MTTTTLANPRILIMPGAPRRGLLVGFLGALAVGLFGMLGVSLGVAATHDGRILPGVQVAGVSVAGLDRGAAASRLQAELPPIASGAITVVVDGTAVEVPYADIGRGYQVDAMLDGAFGIGRSGNPAADAVARLQVLARETNLPLAAHPEDPAAVNRVVAELAAKFMVVPVDASVSYDPVDGFAVTPAVDGARVDRVALRQALIGAASRADMNPVRISFARIAVAPSVSTADARAVATAAGWMSATPLALQAGDDNFALSVETIVGLLTFERSADGAYAAVVDEVALAEQLATFAAQVVREPVDASFTWSDAGVLGVTPAVTGRALNVDGSLRSVVNALEARAGGSLKPVASLALVTTQPPLSTEAAQAAVSKMQRLSSWTTYYEVTEGNFWGANISIPAWDIDKLVIAPGEWFDWWDDIGPVTTERGYGYGGAIINGRSVRNGALAGGMCSTSTTIFNAAMRAGLEIGARNNHYYYISRYPMGLDATVMQTETFEDTISFRNDTANPIVIRSYTGYGFVRFDIWGVPDGRTVTLSAPSTSNARGARDTTVVNPNLAPGTAVRVEYPHDGFDASVTRWVRDAAGNVIWENTWFSRYSAVNGITEVGPAPAAPAEPPAPA